MSKKQETKLGGTCIPVETVQSNDDSRQMKQFAEVVGLIRTRRNELLRTANTALMETYWQVGKYISEKISQSAWGDGVVKQLAQYIERNAPELKGFSKENLHRMRRFYEMYHLNLIVSPLVTQLSWTNNILIMSRCEDEMKRLLQQKMHEIFEATEGR